MKLRKSDQSTVDKMLDDYTRAKIERKKLFGKRESKKYFENRRGLKRSFGGIGQTALSTVYSNQSR